MIAFIFAFATLFSIYKFEVINPFLSCFAMLKILYTDEQYIEVQNCPQKVIFSKGNNSKELLDKFMNDRGFYEITEERMGADLVYSNGSQKECIYYSTNQYYSKWIWNNDERNL